jgi:hypothetical protein
MKSLIGVALAAIAVVPAAFGRARGEKYGSYIDHWAPIEEATARGLLMANAEQCLRGLRHGEIALEFNKRNGLDYVSGWTAMVYGPLEVRMA